MPSVHPTAIIDSSAIIDDTVIIGPYAIIGSNVKIGANTNIGPYTHIVRDVEIGTNNIFHSSCCIGDEPQDLKHKGMGKVIIGDNNIFREFVTIHLPTVVSGVTQVGSNCYFMANAHVAHDCIVSDNVILVNYVGLSGFSKIDKGAILSGYCGTHQFTRVGSYAMVGLHSKIAQDVPPYVMTSQLYAKAHAINVVGLRRAGFSLESRNVIKKAFKVLYHEGLSIPNALTKIENTLLVHYDHQSDEYQKLRYFVDFCRASKRGLISAAFTLRSSGTSVPTEDIE